MSASDHRVHGLGTDSMAPDWPPLIPAEVAGVLARLPAAPELRAITWKSPRPLSAAALVETSAGALFVKRHHRRVRTPAALATEHALIARLRERGIPVPALLPDRSGETAIATDAWTYEVHAPARGQDIYRDATSWTPPAHAAHAWQAGAQLARLHQALEGFSAPQRETHILVARSEILAAADPVGALSAQLPGRPGLAAYLAQRDWQNELAATLAGLHERLHPALADQPPLWTHGDWHVSNLCWSGPGPDALITDVLDFGLAARTFALFDLATAIERNAIAWLALEEGGSAARPDIARALIEGYASVRPLGSNERGLLADLLPLVHVDFALSEVEYFAGVVRSPSSADVAWHTFLHGHAAWFHTPPGAALLRTVRSSA